MDSPSERLYIRRADLYDKDLSSFQNQYHLRTASNAFRNLLLSCNSRFLEYIHATYLHIYILLRFCTIDIHEVRWNLFSSESICFLVLLAINSLEIVTCQWSVLNYNLNLPALQQLS